MADPKFVLTLAAKLGIPGDDITVDCIATAGRTPTVQVTLRMAELVTEPFAPAPAEETRWREHEAVVDGGYCGCEYPRLWPPAPAREQADPAGEGADRG